MGPWVYLPQSSSTASLPSLVGWPLTGIPLTGSLDFFLFLFENSVRCVSAPRPTPARDPWVVLSPCGVA